MPADLALQAGLLTEVVPHEQLTSRATELATTIAAHDQEMTGAIRAAYDQALNLPADEASALAAAASRAAGIPTARAQDVADRLMASGSNAIRKPQ